MKNVFKLSVIAGSLAFLVTPASAQMTTSKSTMHSHTAGMQAMMPECSAMMKEFMADPIVQKRMMSIMQKHMKQHAGQGSMMMQGNSSGSDSSGHVAHHSPPPAAMPTPENAPSPVPSP